MNASPPRSFLLAALAAVVALALSCTDESGPRTDAGSPGDGGPDAGPPPDLGGDGGPAPDASGADGVDTMPPADLGGDALPDEQTPIVDRPSSGAYVCRVSRDRTDHSPKVWLRGQAVVTTTGGMAFLARVEGSSPLLPPAQSETLALSTFGADGSFGPALTVAQAPAGELGGVVAVRAGQGFALLWIRGNELGFATFDAQGAPILAPRALALPGVSSQSTPRLAAGADGGFGLVYSAINQLDPAEAFFVTLDATGSPRGTPRSLVRATSPYTRPGPTIAATADGYALLWRAPVGKRGEIHFATADSAGAEAIAPRAVSGPGPEDVAVGIASGFDRAANPLLPVAGGYLAAWTESTLGDFATGTGAWSIVRVARLDASGAVLGSAPALRAPADGIDEVEPGLLAFGEAVAVSWARGTHIYVCAGCVPDHRIDLILIDPATLAPASNIVSVTNGGGPKAGGLLQRDVAAIGSTLLTTYNLTFHVHATPGSASFTCEPR